MKRILLLLTLSLQSLVLINAQSKVEISDFTMFSTQTNGTGKIYFSHPEGFNDIISNKSLIVKKAKVWRVRIYMGTGNNAREDAKAVRAAFISQFPEVEAQTVYPSPYFKVLVGVFDTRLQAECFRTKLLNTYPDCIVETGIVEIGIAKETIDE